MTSHVLFSKAKIQLNILPWVQRYDYPEPGSRRDLWGLGQVDYVEYGDGFLTASFRKRAGRNAMPYVSGSKKPLVFFKGKMGYFDPKYVKIELEGMLSVH